MLIILCRKDSTVLPLEYKKLILLLKEERISLPCLRKVAMYGLEDNSITHPLLTHLPHIHKLFISILGMISCFVTFLFFK